VKTIVIDFDGTICGHAFPEIGEVKPGVKAALEKLRQHFEIVISSCRASKMFRNEDGSPSHHVDAMVSWLDWHGIPYDRIDMGDEGKVVATAYIDDRAIRFEDNWEEITDQLIQEHTN